MNYRKIGVFTLFLLLTFGLAAQSDLSVLDMNRVGFQQKGMLVLGSWATLNVISSLALNNRLSGSQRYFNQMNGYWNAVNLAIAAGGYFLAAPANPLQIGNVLLEQSSIEKILLFNAALDVGYMIGGAYLIERSKNSQAEAERLKGFGQSVILQGGFLFVFDLVLYSVMHGNYLKIIEFTNANCLALLPSGIVFSF